MSNVQKFTTHCAHYSTLQYIFVWSWQLLLFTLIQDCTIVLSIAMLELVQVLLKLA